MPYVLCSHEHGYGFWDTQMPHLTRISSGLAILRRPTLGLVAQEIHMNETLREGFLPKKL